MSTLQTLNNGESWVSFRTKLNDNYTALNTDKVETSDYTDANVKTKYETNADTNAYTDAEKTKLAWLSASWVSWPISSTDNAVPRYNGTSGAIIQDSWIIIDDNDNISWVESLKLNTSPSTPLTTPWTKRWNTIEHTSETLGDLWNVVQDGQELWLSFYNDTWITIPNGIVVIPRGWFDVWEWIIQPTVELALADNFANIDGTIFITTTETLNWAEWVMTRFGKVRGLDTSGFTPWDDLYVSPTVAWEITNVRPDFPDYEIRIWGALASDLTNWEIGVNTTSSPKDTIDNAWDWSIRETISFWVTSDGATITWTLQNADLTNDLTMIFSDGIVMLDVTPAKTVTLTAWTDSNPQSNYVYIPISTKVLTVSTTEFPATEHIAIAFIVLRTVGTTQTDWALRNNNWNDHIKTTWDNGHILHITERIRQLPAKWNDWIVWTSVVNWVSDVDVATTSGHVYQLHKQTFIWFNTATWDDLHIVNDSVSPYKTVTNLGAENVDALWNTLANSSFSIVLWWVQNKTWEMSHMMINMPVGSYAKNSPSSAVTDALNFSVYDIPTLFEWAGFLIARFTYQLEADWITWTLFDTQDLRGKIPNTTAWGWGWGGWGWVTEWTWLSDTPALLVASKFSTVNAWASALELTKDVPAWAVVGTTDSQLLTNKTVNGVVLSDGWAATSYLDETGAYSVPPSAWGWESNTASNVWTAWVWVFKQKVWVDLQFKKINWASTKIIISDDIANDEVDIDVVEANIVHQNLSGAGTNTHAQLDSHVSSTSNPHSVTKAQVGLTNVDDIADASQTSLWTVTVGNVDAIVTSSSVWLSNVDNTSDATKDGATATLTNKRITERVNTITSSATPTPVWDTTDVFTVTALAAAATIAAPTGTPTEWQKLIIRIKDNATARTLAWNAIYRAWDVALPTTTILSKTLYVGFQYNSTDSKWDLLAYNDNF